VRKSTRRITLKGKNRQRRNQGRKAQSRPEQSAPASSPGRTSVTQPGTAVQWDTKVKPWKRWPGVIWGVWKVVIGGSIAAILGIFTQPFFRPMVSVSYESALDPRNPFTIPFRVKNDWVMPLYDMTFVCRLDHVRMGNNEFVGGEVGKSPPTSIPRLDAKAETTIPCYNSIQAGAKSISFAEVSFPITYRPYRWLPFRYTDTRLFYAERDANGTLRWLPKQ